MGWNTFVFYLLLLACGLILTQGSFGSSCFNMTVKSCASIFTFSFFFLSLWAKLCTYSVFLNRHGEDMRLFHVVVRTGLYCLRAEAPGPFLLPEAEEAAVAQMRRLSWRQLDSDLESSVCCCSRRGGGEVFEQFSSKRTTTHSALPLHFVPTD